MARMNEGRGERSNQGDVTSRVPPHNLSAEESLLGALLLSRDAMGAVTDLRLNSGDFYKPAHQHIFEAIRVLLADGQIIDSVTVAEELRRAGLLDAIGGTAVLLELVAGTPSVTNAPRYARIVQNTALLRKLIGVAGELTDLAFSGPDDVDKALDLAETKVFEIAENRQVDSVRELGDLLPEVIDEIERIQEQGHILTGAPTGYTDLDELLTGLQPSTLCIVGARPSMGKTAFALGLAVNVAIEAHKPVLFFSLEMGHRELAQRILASEARVDSSKFRKGNLEGPDWTKINRALGRLEAPLHIDDNPNTTVMEIRAKARRLQAKSGQIGLIIIDYLQLMTGGGESENRQLEVSEMSRGLKILARELECPIMALSQLSRQLEQRADKRPMLSDLRESGSLEQDADIVMFIYRDEVYNADSPDRGVAEIIVAKHRNGPIGKAKLVFVGQHTRFENAARGV
jgi:replicative DNA helicase